ncbi:hypothetical protein BN2497_449 [Janthinobacterium sp. CG23_2]|nr:hypothetical protein BN2497_449 [Janthinobacterium sp. CG23_2]CUU26622.1 hypothetical protein BN3177_449 [Janthinobacterium sp. CG23_2]
MNWIASIHSEKIICLAVVIFLLQFYVSMIQSLLAASP